MRLASTASAAAAAAAAVTTQRKAGKVALTDSSKRTRQAGRQKQKGRKKEGKGKGKVGRRGSWRWQQETLAAMSLQ